MTTPPFLTDKPERLLAWIEETFPEEEVLLADGFEAALIGIGQAFTNPLVAVYDTDKCLAILMERDGMTYEEAVEFFEFNVIGAYVGEKTPMFIRRFDTVQPDFQVQ